MNKRLRRAISMIVAIVTVMAATLVSFAGQSVSELERVTPFTGIKIVAIRTAVDFNKCVCVLHDSTEDKANVHIYDYFRNNLPQTWKMKYMGDGFYSFINTKTQKALDVASGTAKDQTNVQQYPPNGTDAQLFALCKAPRDGYYYIKSKLGNYFLDVAGGKSVNNTNLQIYSFNATPAQMFYFDTVDYDSAIERDIPFYGSKTVLIKAAVDDNRRKVVCVKGDSMSDRANVHIYDYCDNPAQTWTMTYEGYGYYSFRNSKSGKALDVTGGIAKDGSNIQQYPPNGTDAQLFAIYEAPIDGTYHIKSKLGPYYIDVAGCENSNNTNVQLYSLGYATPAQMFSFEEITINNTKLRTEQIINKAGFSNGTTWNSNQRPKLSNYSGKGCFAYVADLIKYIFGIDNPRAGKRFTSINSISSGCVLHLSPTHWIYVIDRNGNSLYTAEGNASSKICIKNGKYRISGSKIKTNYSTFSFVEGFKFE